MIAPRRHRPHGPPGLRALRWSVGVVAPAVLVAGIALAMQREKNERMAAPAEPLTVLEPISARSGLFRPIGITTPGAELPTAPTFAPSDPVLAGLDPRHVDAAIAMVIAEVQTGTLPGAALVLGRGSGVVASYGVGAVGPGGATVVPDWTIYDLASLTKVIATTTAVMLLVEDGRISLDAPVVEYLPEFRGLRKDAVTIRHLLTHTSGLPAGLYLPPMGRDEAMRRILETPLRWRPGQRVEYSDLGPIVLFAAAERVAGESIPHLLHRRIFRPLGMRNTGFDPIGPCERCAPTAHDIHGKVHDPLAQRLGGIAGNAGLFSTAGDVARFAAMLAGGGELEGVRVLSAETVAEFTRRQPKAGTRALGWDTPDPAGAGAAGLRISPSAFGHTGFTGTSLWVDPERGTWAVLLTNRTLFEAPNRIQELRRAIHDQLAEAVDLAIAD